MTSAFMSWFGITLLGTLLYRAIRGHFLSEYPYFYFYVAFVFSQSVVRFSVARISPELYANVYWSTEFLSAIVGCLVIWEIYSRTLTPYPGVSRFSRSMILIAITAVLAKLFLTHANNPMAVFFQSTTELDRNLRSIQAIFLVFIVALLYHYSIPLGRNMLGIISGYTFFVAVSVIGLAVRFLLTRELQLQPISYDLAMVFWCITLWYYEPNPQPATETGLETDYHAISTATARAFSQARSYLLKSVRP
jgi:hypothetical protein